MPREYRHIQQYEKEIIELWKQGKHYEKLQKSLGFARSKCKSLRQDIIENNENSQQE